MEAMRIRIGGYLTSVAVLAVCTVVLLLLRSSLNITDFAMVYLLGVVIVSVRCKQLVAIVHSVASLGVFHYFFLPHQNSFILADWNYVFTLIAMLVVALVISTLTARIREHTARAMEHELAIQTERMRSSLLSAVSHDLRTPLASIYGSATTLRDQGNRLDGAARFELVEGIVEETFRLNRLVSNLLEMTRLDSGLKIKKEWHPLEEIVGAALHQMRPSLRGRLVKVHTPADLPLVRVDDVLMEQVFINLLENAVKYTPSGTPLEITAIEGIGRMIIEVRDHGPGFAPDIVQSAFERFSRGKTDNCRGVGLGLAICRSILTAHDGVISAGNARGGGAVVKLELPLGGIPPKIGTVAEVVLP
jgi:two-component system sensor histidine kinase KdpD